MQTQFEVFTDTGIVEPAVQCASPNQDARPDGSLLRLVVLHGISLPPGQFGGTAIEAFFTNTLDHGAHPYFEEIRGMQVSAHLLVRRDGSVLQFVPLTERAWHAGESSFCGRTQCNDFSLGVELEGTDEAPYEDAQYERLVEFARLAMTAWPAITPERIVGHCDIAPGRKTDPGPAFDWNRVRKAL